MKRFENLKAVLFDLDGTLVNTLPGLTELVNQMRSDFDKPPLSEEKRRSANTSEKECLFWFGVR